MAFLDRADAVWQDYCRQMLTVRCIFLYLDRTFVISLPGLKSIFDMGLQLLRAHLEQNPQVVGPAAPWRAGAGRTSMCTCCVCDATEPRAGRGDVACVLALCG